MARTTFSTLATESPPKLASIFCEEDSVLAKNALSARSLREISF